jgi:glycine/sarcosine/betaine reductase complex component A
MVAHSSSTGTRFNGEKNKSEFLKFAMNPMTETGNESFQMGGFEVGFWFASDHVIFRERGVSGGQMLKGKKIIAIGERDGVPGPVIAECLEGAGYEVVFQATECFV